MTIHVSTIRVSGITRLKALIARGRESRVTAEVELLSSTSNEVCEMWNGHEVVRVQRKPATFQFVVEDIERGTHVQILSLQEAWSHRWVVEALGRNDDFTGSEFRAMILGQAPNPTLNNQGAEVSNYELWLLACPDAFLQIMAIIAPALVSRERGWPLSVYCYTCYVFGTVLVCVGLALCSHVIGGTTTEFLIVPNKDNRLQIITV